MSQSTEPAQPAADQSASDAKSRADEHDPLRAAVQAIDRGDLVEARRLASELAQSADPGVQTRARALSQQLAVDPVVVAVMLATGALIVVLYLVYGHAF